MIITVATKSADKLHELRHIAAESHFEVELATVPEAPEVAEVGETLFENALLKARSLQPVEGGDWVLGEDTGLEIPALAGCYGLNPFPGARSNRWMTPEIQRELLEESACGPLNDDSRNRGILRLMNGQARREAKYYCDMVLYRPIDKMLIHARGVTRLAIIPSEESPRGNNGFGYDPIMLALEAATHKTMAELSLEEKNRISHRAKAFLDLLSKVF